METLRGRIEKIQLSGAAGRGVADQLFDLLTEEHPAQQLREFFASAAPPVQSAMQEAVLGLFGGLPPWMLESEYEMVGGKLAALCLQLQMTGYMFRNAEYVQALQALLGVRAGGALPEYRAAFDRVDADGSGYIDAEEVSSSSQCIDSVRARLRISRMARATSMAARSPRCSARSTALRRRLSR